MLKITNDGLTRSDTRRFIAVPIYIATVGVKGLKRRKVIDEKDVVIWRASDSDNVGDEHDLIWPMPYSVE